MVLRVLFKNPYVLEIGTKTFTGEKMISGVFVRAPGGGRPDHRLEVGGAGRGVCGVHDTVLSTYVPCSLSTRRSSCGAESRRLVEEVRRDASLTAGLGWPQALRQGGTGGGPCQPGGCGPNVCPQATGLKPDTQCDGLRRRSGQRVAPPRGAQRKPSAGPHEGTRRSPHPDDCWQDLSTSGTGLRLQPQELRELGRC